MINPSTLETLSRLKEKISSTKATNKSPLYNTMLYWSQKPYTITRVLIEELTKPNDVIMDPFMGSGVTLLEAQHRNHPRVSIGVDVNEMPIFLCKMSASSLSASETTKLLALSALVKDYSKRFYSTDCAACHSNSAIITKTLYDREPFNVTEVWYKCSCSKKTLKKKPSERDIELFTKSYPAAKYIDDIRLLENTRIAVKANERISSKFSPRNFYVLDLIKGEIEKETCDHLKDVMYYIFASILHKSKILDVKMSSQWPLWIPSKNCVERNVAEVFCDSIAKFLDSREYVAAEYNDVKFTNTFDEAKQAGRGSFIFSQGIQNLAEDVVPDACVDLVITDPPYLGQVPYSEYMQIYKAFLGKNINFTDEIVMTNAKERRIEYEEYIHMMSLAFRNISRIMKQKALMLMYFHDPSLKFWNDLARITADANLAFITTIHIDKSVKTLKKILDPKKTMSGETFIVFQKDDVDAAPVPVRTVNDNDISALKQIAEDIIHDRPSRSATTSMLYDGGVLEYIISNGIISDFSQKYSDLADFFAHILEWNENTGEWELAGAEPNK